MGKELRKCGSSWEYCDGECDNCAANTKIVTSGSTEGSYGNINGLFTMKGWICPRCGRANAPWVSHCDCIATETGTTNLLCCIHEWECVGADTEGFTYRCRKCGATKRNPISSY